MKRLCILGALLLLAAGACAERITFTTGDLAGTSVTDRFMPSDFSMLGAACTVSAVSKADGGLWRLRLTAARSGTGGTYPVEYEYYVKPGDIIRLRRMNASAGGLSECTLRVVSADWNTMTFDVE